MSEVLTSMEGELTKQGARVVVEPNLPSVRGNRATLIRVLTNLLSNAAKFVAEGTPPRIHIGSEIRDAWVRLWVEDDGIGIPPEHRERVFGVFEHLHHQKAYAGTGIGLAIVRKAKESRFWIELPGEKGESTHGRN